MNKILAILKANKTYVIDGGIFVLAAVAFTGSTLFVLQNIATYSDIQTKIAALSRTYEINDQALVQFQKSEITKNSFLDALPTQDTIINWLQQTEIMAKLANVDQALTFTNASLTKDTIIVPQASLAQGTPTISGNVIVKGSYNGVLEYVNMLNHSYFYTRITGITFSAIKQSTSTGTTPTVTPTATPTNPNATVSATISFDLFIRDASTQAVQQ